MARLQGLVFVLYDKQTVAGGVGGGWQAGTSGHGACMRNDAQWTVCLHAQRLHSGIAHLEAKGAHALLQLLLHVARNVLLGCKLGSSAEFSRA